MRCRFSLAVALLLSVAFVPAAQAGPPEVVAALKGTPATLFDLSLARLEALVQSDGNANGYYGHVYFQDDELNIYAWSLEAAPTDEACKAILDHLKRLAAVDPETGFPDDPASAFATFFSYLQIDEFAVDPTYMETVDSMFRLTAVIGVAGDGQAVICKSPLLSRDVTYARE